jgi:DNA-binding LacI/PurR family transcriptional regulator
VVAVQSRRPTSADVAKESGFSRATVSYVLNGTAKQAISAETRRRVLEAAERLGYAPYAPARALRSGRSDVILFLIPEWPIGPAIASFIERLSVRLADANLTLVVHAHPRSARPAGELWKTIAPAVVINHQALTPAEEETAMRAGMLVVTPVFQPRGSKTFHSFQRRIGELQVRHLMQAGHRRLGFALPDDDRLLAFTAPRHEGATRACTELGLPKPVGMTVPLDATAASDATARWMAEEPRITAVCAYNDEVGLAVLAGMRTQKLTAPQDLAVIGVDDIPAARLSAPALTTIATGMTVFGEHLAAQVSCALQGRPAPPRPTQDVLQIIQRQTT